MQVTDTRIDGHMMAMHISTDHAELIVLIEMGPRIISLKRRGGTERMFRNLVTNPDYAETGWRGMGGARPWASDGEVCDEGIRAYAQDNGPCEVSTSDDRQVVTVWGAIDPRFMIQRGFEIRKNNHWGFDVTSLLKNCSQGGMPLQGGMWAVAAVDFGETGSTTLGILTGKPDSNWQVGDYRIIWDWAGHHTQPEFISDQLAIAKGLVCVTPKGFEGKLMANSPLGTIVVQNDDTSFFKVIQCDPRLNSLLPGRCNTAVYTCGQFAESETMGPTTFVEAGNVLRHTERWALYEPVGWNVDGLNNIAISIASDGIPA